MMTPQQRLERRFAVLCPTLTLLGIAVFLLIPVSSAVAGCRGSQCGGGVGFTPVWTLLSWQAVVALGVDFCVSLAVAYAGIRHADGGGGRSGETVLIGTIALWLILIIGIATVGAFLAPAALSATAATVLSRRRGRVSH